VRVSNGGRCGGWGSSVSVDRVWFVCDGLGRLGVYSLYKLTEQFSEKEEECFCTYASVCTWTLIYTQARPR